MADYQPVLTQDQLNELAVLVENIVRRRTSGVAEVEIVAAFDGLTSFPAIYEAGGVSKVVRVRMSALGDLLLSVAAPDLEALDAAVDAAQAALEGIDAVIVRATAAADRADGALGSLQELIDASRAAAGRAESAAESAGNQADAARTQAARAQTQADAAAVKIAETEAARAAASSAAADAVEVAGHPPVIGSDHYWYVWNRATGAYDKTAYIAKGDPGVAHYAASYDSLDAMRADHDNPALALRDLVIITAGTNRGDVWEKTDDTFIFIANITGAIGLPGKTPQFLVGQRTTGPAGSQMDFSFSDGGEDEEGNPRVVMNLEIPRGDTGKPLTVLPNGHFGNWDEATQTYGDSGVAALATADLQNTPLDFEAAAERENVASGETLPTMFGKIRKFFASLGSLAFKNRVDYTADVDNALALAAADELPRASGSAAAGSSAAAARADHVHPTDDTKVSRAAASSTSTGTTYARTNSTSAGTGTDALKPVSTSATSGHIVMRTTSGAIPVQAAATSGNYAIGKAEVASLIAAKTELVTALPSDAASNPTKLYLIAE